MRKRLFLFFILSTAKGLRKTRTAFCESLALEYYRRALQEFKPGKDVNPFDKAPLMEPCLNFFF